MEIKFNKPYTIKPEIMAKYPNSNFHLVVRKEVLPSMYECNIISTTKDQKYYVNFPCSLAYGDIKKMLGLKGRAKLIIG